MNQMGHLSPHRLIEKSRGTRSRWDTMAHYALALDVGGTFTDVMLMHRESGQLWTVKTPSTPADASEGFFRVSRKYCTWQRWRRRQLIMSYTAQRWRRTPSWKAKAPARV